MRRTFVIKLGGSFLLAGGSPNAELLTGMANTVKKISSKGAMKQRLGLVFFKYSYSQAFVLWLWSVEVL